MQKENLYEKVIDEMAEFLKLYMGKIGVDFSNNIDPIGIFIEYINFQEKWINRECELFSVNLPSMVFKK